MAGSVVIQSFYLAQTVVQLDRLVVRNQPLAILPSLDTITLVNVAQKTVRKSNIVYVVFFTFKSFTHILF